MQNAPPPPVLVHSEISRYRHFRDRLLAEIPDLDEETLSDTLEGITDLREMLAEVVRSALDDEALAGSLSTRMADMKARLERFEARARRKRELALRAMAEAEIPKLAEPDFTASLRQGAPKLEVIAEDKIPAAYWKPQPPKLDKQGLLAALKVGTAIEGASLMAAQMQLSVRTK
jgi:Siphovirus Gp157